MLQTGVEEYLEHLNADDFNVYSAKRGNLIDDQYCKDISNNVILTNTCLDNENAFICITAIKLKLLSQLAAVNFIETGCGFPQPCHFHI